MLIIFNRLLFCALCVTLISGCDKLGNLDLKSIKSGSQKSELRASQDKLNAYFELLDIDSTFSVNGWFYRDMSKKAEELAEFATLPPETMIKFAKLPLTTRMQKLSEFRFKNPPTMLFVSGIPGLGWMEASKEKLAPYRKKMDKFKALPPSFPDLEQAGENFYSQLVLLTESYSALRKYFVNKEYEFDNYEKMPGLIKKFSADYAVLMEKMKPFSDSYNAIYAQLHKKEIEVARANGEHAHVIIFELNDHASDIINLVKAAIVNGNRVDPAKLDKKKMEAVITAYSKTLTALQPYADDEKKAKAEFRNPALINFFYKTSQTFHEKAGYVLKSATSRPEILAQRINELETAYHAMRGQYNRLE